MICLLLSCLLLITSCWLLIAGHCLKLPLYNLFWIGDGGELAVLFEVERLVLGKGVVGEENAFKMIVFVEKDASFEGFESFGELATVFIDSLDLDFIWTKDRAVEVGDGETTFKVWVIGFRAEGEIV